MRLTPRLAEFLRFCLVGGVGFIVDAALLELLVRLGMAPAYARLGSLALAMQVTYALNARFTFRRPVRALRPWATFMATNALGAAINYSVFLAVLSAMLFDNSLLDRQCALVSGTGIALFFNYWANRRFVFQQRGM